MRRVNLLPKRRPGRPSTRAARCCLHCGAAFVRHQKSPNRFCSRACYLVSDFKRAQGIQLGRSLKGKPSNNPYGNGGKTKGRKATGRQLEGLRIGWQLRGADKPSWKDGATVRNHGHRATVAYRRFRERMIDERQECQECGSRERLELDHIEPVSWNPDRVLDETNVRVLCHACHVLTPTYAGRANRR